MHFERSVVGTVARGSIGDTHAGSRSGGNQTNIVAAPERDAQTCEAVFAAFHVSNGYEATPRSAAE